VAIPIQNIYYLLCYAWDKLEALDMVDVSGIPADRQENLFAKVLSQGVAKLISRGLDRGYISREERGRRIRGKLLMSTSVKSSLFQRGMAACEVDELSYDVPHNRVLKASMRVLMSMPTVERALRQELRSHVVAMSPVADLSLAPTLFRPIQLHRNNARYAFLIHVCELLCGCLLPDPESGKQRFHPFDANEQKMGKIFELFVKHFLRREQSDYRVTAPKIDWVLEPRGWSASWLPEMRTDIVLANPGHQILIDAKFYKERVSSSGKLQSSHLYQLMSYLTHFPPGPPTNGVLLYAGDDALPRLDFCLGGREVSIRSLDLDQPWQAIRRDLLALPRSVPRVR
jgi:5-methylcytosine-specific restriction enzyme subunit McrC